MFAPELASLWQVDHRGAAVGKPWLYRQPLAQVQKLWVDLVNNGVDPTGVRITPNGERPDDLGYRSAK